MGIHPAPGLPVSRIDARPLLRLGRILAGVCLSLVAVLSLLALLPLPPSGLSSYLDPLSSPRSLAFLVSALGLGVLLRHLHSTWLTTALGSSLLLLLLLLGYLYTYSRHVFPLLSEEETPNVLRGEREDLSCVLFEGEIPSPLPPHRLVAELPENAQTDTLRLLCAPARGE